MRVEFNPFRGADEDGALRVPGSEFQSRQKLAQVCPQTLGRDGEDDCLGPRRRLDDEFDRLRQRDARQEAAVFARLTQLACLFVAAAEQGDGAARAVTLHRQRAAPGGRAHDQRRHG